MFDYQRVASSKLRSTRAWVRGWKIRFHEELAIFSVYLNSVEGFSAPHFTVTLQHPNWWEKLPTDLGPPATPVKRGHQK